VYSFYGTGESKTIVEQKFGKNLRNLEAEFLLLCAKIPSHLRSKLRCGEEENATFAFFFF